MNENPASVSSKEELTERLIYGLERIKNGKTLTLEEVVAFIQKLKTSTSRQADDTNPIPLHNS